MSWYKTAKFINDHCAICMYCSDTLRPQTITENPKHVYSIGTVFSCRCGKSRLCTNFIRNIQSFLDYLEGKPSPSWGEVVYIQGFCNDKLCGYCQEPIHPLENGVIIHGLDNRLDRYGCHRCRQNQHIAIDGGAEDKEGQTAGIEAWYRTHLSELKRYGKSEIVQ